MPKAQTKMGRPTTFDERLIAPVILAASKGATDEEMAKSLGVSVRTFHRWKNSHPDFCHALKAHKNLADDLMEEALYENGMGGNVTAQIFWLKNRQPDRWRDVRDYLPPGNVTISMAYDPTKKGATNGKGIPETKAEPEQPRHDA